jgi:serine/threonine protein kinase
VGRNGFSSVTFAHAVPDLVLELVKGGDLLDRILSLGGLNEVDTRDIVKQMVDALAVSIYHTSVQHLLTIDA